MRIVSAEDVARFAPCPHSVEALRRAFAQGCEAPPRGHYDVGPTAQPGTLLVMPAWRPGGVIGVKLATVFNANAARGLPAVHASYVLMDGETGASLALIDGGELTARRTAAVSVLAATYLAPADAQRLVVVGTGRIARHAAACYAALFPGLSSIAIWGRDRAKAATMAASLHDLPVCIGDDLETAVRQADIVTCATLSKVPLVRGDWLKPGAHLDLIGGFTPAMRECDDRAIARARIFTDTQAALHEAGDFTQALERGVLQAERVRELAALCRGECPGRQSADEITLFKSVGTALADLAIAELVWRSLPV